MFLLGAWALYQLTTCLVLDDIDTLPLRDGQRGWVIQGCGRGTDGSNTVKKLFKQSVKRSIRQIKILESVS
jgi:hypothetical protein